MYRFGRLTKNGVASIVASLLLVSGAAQAVDALEVRIPVQVFADVGAFSMLKTGAQVEKDRPCTVLEVTHHVPRPYFDFHVAEIFIDDKLNIPVRYAAYSWPTQDGGEKELLEEYTYRDIKINLNMTNADFDAKNTKYNF